MKSVTSALTLVLCFFASTLMAQSIVGDWKIEADMEDGTTIAVKFTISDDGTYAVDMGMDGTRRNKGQIRDEWQ